MSLIQVGGRPLLYVKGSYVDEERLNDPGTRGELLGKLNQLVANYDSATYTQHSPIQMFRRIRWGRLRVYVRHYPVFDVLVILAYTIGRRLKRNELDGSLAYDFTSYLLTHQNYRPDRCQPVLPILEPVRHEIKVHAYRPAYALTGTPITRGEAEDMLLSSRRRAAADPFVERIIGEVYRHAEDDRVLAEKKELSTDDVRRYQPKIAQGLKNMRLDWKVRWDDLSQRFVLIRASRMGFVWAGGMRGGGRFRPSQTVV